MGISASQARLLTITARLTSNEYESQQLSNAKMRLATKSEKASRDYIAALNSQSLQYVSYDAQGAQITQELTANILYNYSGLKNQYLLSNIAGQALVLTPDVKNFRNSRNLDEFLACYGVEKTYRTESLARNAERLAHNEGESYVNVLGETVTDGVKNYMTDWINKVDIARNAYYRDWDMLGAVRFMTAEERYAADKDVYENGYTWASENLANATEAYQNDPSDEHYNGLIEATQEYNKNRADYYSCSTFENWVKWKASGGAENEYGDKTVHFLEILPENTNGLGYINLSNSGEQISTGYREVNSGGSGCVYENAYENVEKYYEVLNEYLTEAEGLGCDTLEETYQYNDPDKAQWYTNLWYQMNGESSYKSSIGENETNFAILDGHLATSTQWLRDALSQGIITLSISTSEKVSNTLNTNVTFNPLLQDIDVDELMSNPLNVTLKGISWKAMEYTSAGDFVEKDDNKAIAKAQAEYEKATNEISIKDKKYESKIKTLDVEHNALQTEYQSVKSAMDKNIDRSYKTFNG